MCMAEWARYTLDFKFEARTSRERMRHKDTYFVRVRRDGRTAYGECALFRGLSTDDQPDYEERLDYYCRNLDRLHECTYSSIRFGLETALYNLDHPVAEEWHDCNGIPINGLVWMGDKATMAARIEQKLTEGFKVLKLKIGGIDFDDEVELLDMVRRRFPSDVLEIRLDANGSFSPDNAMKRLGRLARYDIHSIEQPVAAGQHDVMRRVCAESPIPVALDEELIGYTPRKGMGELLEAIRPAYIILKPALCGGLSGACQWADAAEAAGIPYWFTSALESNIGLDAIARLALRRGVAMPQGLGTGELYHNNVASPLYREGAYLKHNEYKEWQTPELQWNTPIF